MTEKGACKGIGGIGKLVANEVPVVGPLFVSTMNTAIDFLYGARRKKKLENKVNIINRIIMFNKDPNTFTEEDWNLLITKVALDVTRSKEDIIKNPPLYLLLSYPYNYYVAELL